MLCPRAGERYNSRMRSVYPGANMDACGLRMRQRHVVHMWSPHVTKVPLFRRRRRPARRPHTVQPHSHCEWRISTCTPQPRLSSPTRSAERSATTRLNRSGHLDTLNPVQRAVSWPPTHVPASNCIPPRGTAILALRFQFLYIYAYRSRVASSDWPSIQCLL